MSFAEDINAFTDADTGFAVDALVAGNTRQIILDGPGVDALGGEVVTTEPSALIQATHAVAVGNALVLDGADLPSYMSHLAGTYSVRSVMPEPPDGVFVRAFLARA